MSNEQSNALTAFISGCIAGIAKFHMHTIINVASPQWQDIFKYLEACGSAILFGFLGTCGKQLYHTAVRKYHLLKNRKK